MILFTSGTTGDPKGVMLSHENILSNIQVIREIADTEQSSFSILPLSHVYELTCNLLASIRNGTKVHFCSSLDSKNMFNELKMIKPNIMPVVPLILDKIKTNCLKTSVNPELLCSYLNILLNFWIFIKEKNRP